MILSELPGLPANGFTVWFIIVFNYITIKIEIPLLLLNSEKFFSNSQ